MAGKNLDYWYDAQIRRYLIQLVRVFSQFQVQERTDSGVRLSRVPCKYGDSSRMVNAILRNNSENVIQSAPQMALTIAGISPMPEGRYDPYLVDKVQVAEREWDVNQGVYTSEQGNLYTVDRYMPTPFEMNINLDIWTTNTTNKLELLEQLFILFNPALQLQVNDNPLDWGNVFEIEMMDVQWSSRSIPQGTEEQLDIATISFKVWPIFISPPAKVTKQSIINRIITNLHSVDDVDGLGYSFGYYDFFNEIVPDATDIITPGEYRVQVAGSLATLVDNQGNEQLWSNIIELHGEISQTSRLQLNITNDPLNDSTFVTGTITDNPGSNTTLIFNLDEATLPSNTLANVDMIIDPRAVNPGNTLPAANIGQRYLLTEPISNDTIGWNFVAGDNDIIEYSASNTWIVSFDSSNVSTEQWVTNDASSAQFKWTGAQWQSSWEGEYNAGFWKLVL